MKESDKALEEEEQKQEKEKTNWWTNTPTYIKVIGVGAIVFLLVTYMDRGAGQAQKYLLYLIGIVLAIYFLGQRMTKKTEMLTPEQAMRAAQKEMIRQTKMGMWPFQTKYWIGPSSGLKNIEGAGAYYLIRMDTREFGRLNYYRWMVDAYLGYATLQENVGPISGRETVPISRPVPMAMRWIKDNKLEKFFGRVG